MTTTMKAGRLRTTALAFGLALICLVAFASGAQAARPAWKLLAVTGPTNLPPKQSEIQRLTIEATGGTFAFPVGGGKGMGTPIVHSGSLTFTEGSAVATIEGVEAGAAFDVGDRITVPGAYEPGETTVVSCSADCKTPGSSVTLSAPAAADEADASREIFTKELKGVEGTFAVGAEVSNPRFEYFPAGTTITAVGPDSLTFSKPTTFEYLASEGAIPFVTPVEPSTSLNYDASAETVQSVLEEVSGAGTVSVSGGPGGTPEHPYFVEFTGSRSEQDVEQLEVISALTGSNPAAHVFTVVPGGPGTGEVVISPVNVGGASTLGNYTLQFGPLPAGIVTAGEVFGEGWECPTPIGESSVTCTGTETVPRLSPAGGIEIPVEVEPTAETTGLVPITISGGGAGPASYQMRITVSRRQALPGAAAFWAAAFDENGEVETQAGSHPYSAQSFFLANTMRNASGKIAPVGDSKTVIVDLPPGFGGNPLATPRCPQSQVTPPGFGLGQGESEVCGPEMRVGEFEPILNTLSAGSATFDSPFFNNVPPQGYAAEFSTKIALPVQSLLASVRSSEDFGIRITAPNNPDFSPIYGSYAALEGEPLHASNKAFLFMPSNCAEGAERTSFVHAAFNTWQSPDFFNETSVPQASVTGCDKLSFHPSFTFQPTSTQGSSPVGATAHLHLPKEGLEEPGKLSPPQLKRAVVQLPAGLTLNPSSANGLEGCSEAQIGYLGKGFEPPNPIRFNEEQPACPDGSKLGTAEVKTPLLENTLAGTVYLANQEENPFGSLLAIYLVVDDPITGVLVKLPGEVQLDPATGQLTTIFDYSPQLPFEDLELKFRGGGPRSEFATPEVCGHYATTGSLTPWSAPESGPPVQIEEAGFDVSNGCASSAGARPFAPHFEAGTTGTQAGAYSPLVVKVGRQDGEQELTSLDFTLPKGLIGKLAGIPYCGDAEIQTAEHKSGKQEQGSPSCPAASQIGTVDTAAGVGPEPFHVGGHVYLASPYKGAPVSSVVITPAVAGPFDLGNVVVRAPLYVDHESAVLTAKSDPIPTILRGIPLKLRSVTINVDKPGFILNPTNCTPMTASASVGSSNGATANPTNRFQVGGCENLKFVPKLKVSLKGGTRRNGNPALTAVLTQAPGQANISRASVALPHSEFLEQGHIRTVCTRVQFAAEQCPAASIYGHAEAISPLLDQPLTGPVYMRSSSNRLPDIVAALKGPASQPIEVDLDGRIDSYKGGIRTTFEAVPDAPVSKFVLKMQGGKKSLIVNSTNICRGSHKATVEMTGQNAKRHNFQTPLKAQCGKKKKSGKK